MSILWLILVTLFFWISFSLYVDSQEGPVKRAVMQRVGSLVLILSAVAILIYGV